MKPWKIGHHWSYLATRTWLAPGARLVYMQSQMTLGVAARHLGRRFMGLTQELSQHSSGCDL